MPRSDGDTVDLQVVEHGSGAPLVLLHGFTGSAREWGAHIDRLARWFRVVAVDLAGHGQSGAPGDPAAYRMERCVNDLAATLDRRGIARAHWLGYSMGGRVALAVAVAQPARVDRLVLESASPGLADPAERRARIAADEALADRIEHAGIEAFVDEWMAQPLFASQRRLGTAALAAARAARRANNPVGLANSLRGLGAGAQEPLWARLPEVAAPTLLMVGEADPKFRAIAAAMAARMPRAEVAVIPEAGHNTHLENPAAFDERVGAFLHAPTDGDGR